jgi:hypothetical protein
MGTGSFFLEDGSFFTQTGSFFSENGSLSLATGSVSFPAASPFIRARSLAENDFLSPVATVAVPPEQHSLSPFAVRARTSLSQETWGMM